MDSRAIGLLQVGDERRLHEVREDVGQLDLSLEALLIQFHLEGLLEAPTGELGRATRGSQEIKRGTDQ